MTNVIALQSRQPFAGPVDPELEELTEAARLAASDMENALHFDTVESRREKVLRYGQALLALRQKIPAYRAFHAHLVEHQVDQRDSPFRSNAIWVAKNWAVLADLLKRCRAAHPTEIRQWHRNQRRAGQTPDLIKPSDNWNFSPVRFPRLDGEDGHGYIPGDLYANCLWYWSRPGDLVVDPMAGAGQILQVYERRNEWMRPEPWDLSIRCFDLAPRGPYADEIKAHDLTQGFPTARADYIVIDPPYFGMVEGQYTSLPGNLANLDWAAWCAAMAAIARSCAAAQASGKFCTVISPNYRDVADGRILLVTREIERCFAAAGYRLHDLAYASRRIQQQQSAMMANANNGARKARIMLTDITEVMTFRR